MLSVNPSGSWPSCVTWGMCRRQKDTPHQPAVAVRIIPPSIVTWFGARKVHPEVVLPSVVTYQVGMPNTAKFFEENMASCTVPGKSEPYTHGVYRLDL